MVSRLYDKAWPKTDTKSSAFVVERNAARRYRFQVLELRHLRYFCAVAEALNFSRAAERLRVAQSALSRQIRDLEREMGVQLFVRTTTSVRLTDAGAHFYQSTGKLLMQLSIGVTEAQEIANGRGGGFNIASDWRFSIHLIPETVLKFRNLYPKVTVNFSDMQSSEQIEALRDGRIHLGFIPEMALGARDDLGLLPIYSAELMAVLPSSHPLAGREALALRELASEKWVRLEDKKDNYARAFIMQLCRPAGFVPKMGRNTTSIAGALALIAAGEGITLLPPLLVPSSYGGISMVPTDCQSITLYAVWLKSVTSPLVERFIKVLSAEVVRPARRETVSRKS